MSLDIIIPVWNQIDLTLQCLTSISMHTRNYRIILIDNGSDFDVSHQLLIATSIQPGSFYVRNPTNLGFVKAVNQGLKLATNKYVAILNNDVEVSPGWAEKLTEPMEKIKSLAATGPLTTTPDCWQGREEVMEPGPNTLRILPSSAMLAFFCVVLRRAVVEEVGYLDERFGLGFGDDDDYCFRIHRAGFDLGLVQDLVIKHHHRSTFKKLYSDDKIKDLEEAGRILFKAKHGLS